MAHVQDLEKTSQVNEIENSRSIDDDGTLYAKSKFNVEVDPVIEKTLVRKLDMIFLPVFAFAYLVAYWDRGNLGNAKIMTLQKDLGMSDAQFYTCVMIFYGGYLTGILPGNLGIRVVGPHRLLGGGIIFFGLMALSMSFATNPQTILGLRYALGIGEAFLQSTVLYMSTWYKRNEVGSRIAIFYSAATLSGVFSGLIAYGVQKDLDGAGGRHAWQWLFLMEGIAAIGMGVIAWIVLPPFPDKVKKSWIFTVPEVEVAVKRFANHNNFLAKFEIRQVWQSLRDPKTYMNAFLSAAASLILAAVSAFLPSIITTYGYTAITAQLFTVIPYACAFVSINVVGILTDRFNNKGYFIFGSFSCSAIGLIIQLAHPSNAVKLFGACLLVMGGYPAAVAQIAWIQVNFCGFTKRAVSWGVAMLFGQGFSMLAAQVYDGPPAYVKGHAILLGFTLWAMLNTAGLHFIMKAQNKRRDQILEEYRERGEAHPDFERSLEEMGDHHISFRYVL